MQGQIYSGSEHMLLIAFHLGATCARSDGSILDPGTEIKIRGIERFPTGGTSTVQYIAYYGRKDNVNAISENENDPVEGIAGEEQLLSVPVDCTNDSPNDSPSAFEKFPEDVFGDFLTHLNIDVCTYIRDIHQSIGHALLDSATTHYTIIGSSERNETIIRAAAKKAGIIKNDADVVRMSFLTEEEAYFENYLDDGHVTHTDDKRGVCIVNIDHDFLTFSSFSYKGCPRQVEEITESQSSFKKGYFTVNEEAQTGINSLIKGSKREKKIPAMLEYFDKTTKPAFRGTNNNPVALRYPGGKEKGSKGGKLILEAKTIASFFEPLIKRIVEGVLNQVQVAREPISRVLLFGEGASSVYIFQETKRRLGNELPDLQVLRLDGPGPGQVPRGGVARAIRCIHELTANVSKKTTTDTLPPAEHVQPVLPTVTDVQANSPSEAVDEAKQALKILENIINTQHCRENEISELREKNEKLIAQAEVREREYLELKEKNSSLSTRLKELEEWRKMVMIGIDAIQNKTYEIMGAGSQSKVPPWDF